MPSPFVEIQSPSSALDKPKPSTAKESAHIPSESEGDAPQLINPQAADEFEDDVDALEALAAADGSN